MVSGIISTTGWIKRGRLLVGKITPEKKNMGEIKPVK